MTETQLTLLDGGREIEQYDPKRHRLNVAAINFGIEEAKRIKDWPTLEIAVDAKIKEQRNFVAWWTGNIRSQGEARKKESRDLGKLSIPEAEKLTGMPNQRVSDLGKRLIDPDKYRERLLGTEYCAAFLSAIDGVRGTQGTGENEWFTPVEDIERARTVLGVIDLDPATHRKAQETVRAAQYFTKDDDGLSKEWRGRVWLNPPYAQPLIEDFVMKLCAERRAGRVTAAICLTHNYTDTTWFHAIAALADAICFTRGRVKFIEQNGKPAAPTQGQAFSYFGDDVPTFSSVFRQRGFIASVIRQ